MRSGRRAPSRCWGTCTSTTASHATGARRGWPARISAERGSMADALTAQQTADAVGVHLFANDRASKAMGMRIVAISEGAAFLEMPVRDDMLNGFDICHGGFITTLADSAFAFACNSTGDMTVA